ncbi:putative nucleotidyltransferase domain-containing protein [Desulfonema limicola]|uniref:Nucleotidyltransferase domain-containing protein n=1 Tax=Desulfonema limicola TaxID=45656 RepID=A0A975B6R3_9BACT|nr:nucleotidyltransferase family protein [Desulfonema limicola]QTA79809.1 putative nucleotidyltransferase domain-containing protein [Desulfonema limicola]
MRNLGEEIFVKTWGTMLILPDVVIKSEGVTCGDELYIEIAKEHGIINFFIRVKGCSICMDSSKYIYEQLNKKEFVYCKKFVARCLRDIENKTYNNNFTMRSGFKIPHGRNECVKAPWKIILLALENLQPKCVINREMTPLACDACVKSYRLTWKRSNNDQKNLLKQTAKSVYKKIINILTKRDDADFRWQPLGKYVLNDTEIQTLKDEIQSFNSNSIKEIKKLRLPALLYNNLYNHNINFKGNAFLLLTKKQRIRQIVIHKEFCELEETIQKNCWKVFAIKGAYTAKLYPFPKIRPYLDYDLIAASLKDAMLLANWLINNKGYQFVVNGSVPFSLKALLDKNKKEVITGHFHLEKILHDTWQIVIDITFPGFYLNRTDIFNLTFQDYKISMEEQCIITLCHIFKHEFVYMKDLNDIYLMIKSGKMNFERVQFLIHENRLELYWGIVLEYLKKDYNLRLHSINTLNNKKRFFYKYLFNDWPYSRKSHFLIKLLDLYMRNKKEHGFFGGLKEIFFQFIELENWKNKNLISSYLEQRINKRIYLYPLMIFNNKIDIGKPIEEALRVGGFDELKTVVENELIIIERNIKIYLTGIGFLYQQNMGK